MRILFLSTGAFGERGGIAQHDRQLLAALGRHPPVRSIVVLPRRIRDPVGGLPDRLRFVRAAAGGKPAYLWALAREVRPAARFDLVVCGHINLLPAAFAASKAVRARVALVVHGIDAWQPPTRRLAAQLASRVDALIAVSSVTRERFLSWCPLPARRAHVLPNAVSLEGFQPGEPSALLRERYAIGDRRVIMTVGRLVSRAREKGFDEVLEVLPRLLHRDARLVYLIVGEGGDRARLERKAQRLGVAGDVVFTGFAPEAEKADHFRLADAYVMPSRGEGFGLVLLEAMACGVPVVASAIDGGRDALRGGMLGRLIDPSDQDALERAVLAALAQGRGDAPAGLDHFSFDNHVARVGALIDQIVAAG